MPEEIEQKLKILRNLKLRKSEKDLLRQHISAYIRASERSSANLRQSKQNETNIFLSLLRRKYMFAGILIAILLATGGGVSVAAEQALPGDALYQVKVGINEPVRAALALSAEAKADVEARFAEKRVAEMEKLAQAGRFSEEKLTIVQARFDEHVEKMSERIARFEEEGKVEIAARLSSKLESRLMAHEKIVAELEARGDKLEEKIMDRLEKFQQHLQRRVDALAEKRLDAERSLSTSGRPEAEAAAERAKTQAQKQLVEVKALLERVNTELRPELVTRASEQIEKAEKLFVEGERLLAAGEFGKAFATFHQSFRISHEIWIFLKHPFIQREIYPRKPEIETQSGGDLRTEVENDSRSSAPAVDSQKDVDATERVKLKF